MRIRINIMFTMEKCIKLGLTPLITHHSVNDVVVYPVYDTFMSIGVNDRADTVLRDVNA